MNQINFVRRTASDKILCDKGFNIAKNPKYRGYQRELFNKKTAGGAIKNENMSNSELAEELQKAIIKIFEYDIWGADLAYMQLISKFNRRIHFFTMCY